MSDDLMDIATNPHTNGRTKMKDNPGQLTRQFETGATRSADNGKPDYEGYLSPLVIQAFGEYMTKHRHLPDGSMRDSDNWQKGIPRNAYIKSLFRHFVDLWKIHRLGFANDHEGKRVTIEDTLAALLFNVQGYFHEYLKAQSVQPVTNGNPEADYQATANRIGGTVIAPNGRHFTSDLREGTATDPHAKGKPWTPAHDQELGITYPTPGVGIDEQDRAAMINKLVEIGCPGPVAVLIAKGTTFSPPNRGPFRFVYVAGPMRGIKDFNFPEFDRVRDYLLTQGYNVISPADIDRADPSDVDPASRQTEYAFRDFQALHFLRAFNCRGNGIVLLNNWEKSTGAAGEFFMGRWLGLRFYKVMGNDNYRNAAPGRLMECVGSDLLRDYAFVNAKDVI